MNRKKKVVYLSGPMTGKPDYNKSEFTKAEKLVKSMGYKVINPHKVKLLRRFRKPVWENYMRSDLRAMMKADMIILLDGWISSEGAQLEVYNATKLKMEVDTLKNFLRTEC